MLVGGSKSQLTGERIWAKDLNVFCTDVSGQEYLFIYVSLENLEKSRTYFSLYLQISGSELNIQKTFSQG